MTVSEPEPEQLPGWQLLDETRSLLTRFVAFPSDAAADAATLWAAHCHATDKERSLVFDSTPRLAVLSDVPGSGKTLLLALLELLTPRAVLMSQPTAPALVNLIRDEHATLLIDEIDLLFGPGNGRRDTRAMLNSGYKRSGKTARANGVVYTFAPGALGGLAQNFCASEFLRPTRERSIILRMRKRAGRAEEYRSRLHDPIALALADSLSAWAVGRGMELATAWPELPEGVDGRTKEIWEPLFAVADVAGGDWPGKASAACRALALGDGSDAAPEASPLQRLLADLRRVFFGADRLTTVTLIERLYAIPGAPWAHLWPSSAAAPRELAALLRPLGVAPSKVWSDGRALQGYRLSDLDPFLPEGEDQDSEECAGQEALPDLPAE